jgi:hypothetical protein
MRRLRSRHRSVVLNRCVAVSARSAWAVRPSAAGAPLVVCARGSAPALAWAVCPSAASVPSASAPPGSLAPSCPPRSFRVQQFPVRVVFFRGQESRLRVQVLEAANPHSISAMAASEESQSLPWDRSSSPSSFRPSLVACPCSLRAGAKLFPSRHTSSHRVGSSHLGRAVRRCLASTAGLTRRCSGLPSAAAELQRWASLQELYL